MHVPLAGEDDRAAEDRDGRAVVLLGARALLLGGGRDHHREAGEAAGHAADDLARRRRRGRRLEVAGGGQRQRRRAHRQRRLLAAHEALELPEEGADLGRHGVVRPLHVRRDGVADLVALDVPRLLEVLDGAARAQVHGREAHDAADHNERACGRSGR